MRLGLPMWPATTSPVAMPIASCSGLPLAWIVSRGAVQVVCDGERAFRVVLAHARRAEHDHQTVAVELVEQAVVLEDDLHGGAEERVEDLDDGFGLEPFGELGEADDVGEQAPSRSRVRRPARRRRARASAVRRRAARGTARTRPGSRGAARRRPRAGVRACGVPSGRSPRSPSRASRCCRGARSAPCALRAPARRASGGAPRSPPACSASRLSRSSVVMPGKALRARARACRSSSRRRRRTFAPRRR